MWGNSVYPIVTFDHMAEHTTYLIIIYYISQIIIVVPMKGLE